MRDVRFGSTVRWPRSEISVMAFDERVRVVSLEISSGVGILTRLLNARERVVSDGKLAVRALIW